MLSGSAFLGKEETTLTGEKPGSGGEVFHFRKGEREFALAWTLGGARRRSFGRTIGEVLDRNGDPASWDRDGGIVHLDGSPRYVIFE